MVRNPYDSAGDIGDMGSIPGSPRSPGGGHGNPLQYSCLRNPMDRGAWRATVHGVKKDQIGLKQLSTHACTEIELSTQYAESRLGWVLSELGEQQSEVFQRKGPVLVCSAFLLSLASSLAWEIHQEFHL